VVAAERLGLLEPLAGALEQPGVVAVQQQHGPLLRGADLGQRLDGRAVGDGHAGVGRARETDDVEQVERAADEDAERVGALGPAVALAAVEELARAAHVVAQRHVRVVAQVLLPLDAALGLVHQRRHRRPARLGRVDLLRVEVEVERQDAVALGRLEPGQALEALLRHVGGLHGRHGACATPARARPNAA
jgi:hypothetical protein